MRSATAACACRRAAERAAIALMSEQVTSRERDLARSASARLVGTARNATSRSSHYLLRTCRAVPVRPGRDAGRRIDMVERTAHNWHAHLPGVGPGLAGSCTVSPAAPPRPEEGHRFSTWSRHLIKPTRRRSRVASTCMLPTRCLHTPTTTRTSSPTTRTTPSRSPSRWSSTAPSTGEGERRRRRAVERDHHLRDSRSRKDMGKRHLVCEAPAPHLRGLASEDVATQAPGHHRRRAAAHPSHRRD